MLLEKYIEKYINENLKIKDISDIDSIIAKLDSSCKALFKSLSDTGDEKYYNHYAFGYLDNVAYRNEPKLEEIGEGAFRRVYAIPGEEWVLKLSMSSEGSKINKEEIEISQGKHGLGARDIFINIYDYDRFSSIPAWVVCQKVYPLEDNMDMEILKKVFPTFWNIIKNEDDVHKTTELHFVNMISSTLNMFGYYLSRSKSPEVAFYRAADGVSELIDFDDVVFYEDFKRLGSAYSYIRSSDMHAGNFGLTTMQNPGPESIVILDFDADSHI